MSKIRRSLIATLAARRLIKLRVLMCCINVTYYPMGQPRGVKPPLGSASVDCDLNGGRDDRLYLNPSLFGVLLRASESAA
jgi:hypothetical protein